MTKKGIDVSEFNGTLDWTKLAKNIDFSMIRAGYGRNNIDATFRRNATACQQNKIPFGAYWFSYALTESDAKSEAQACVSALKDFRPTYPIAFDFEDDSVRYMEQNGIKATKEKIVSIARAFLEEVKRLGYYPILYTNINFINRGFSALTSTYDLWVAQWGVNKPQVETYGMWQYTDNLTIPGCSSTFDGNQTDKDYPKIITGEDTPAKDKDAQLSALKDEMWKKYLQYADQVISGKYGNGTDRKKKLLSMGLDYNLIQEIVTIKLS